MKVFLEAVSVWCRNAVTVILLGPGTWCVSRLVKEDVYFPPSPFFMTAFVVGTLPVLILWPVTIPVMLLLLGLSWLAKKLARTIRRQQKIL